MTIDEFHSQCTAIRVIKVTYDFFSRVVTMVVKPEYGYDASLKNTVFQLQFSDCIYFCSGNTSLQSEDSETEFISWGRADTDTEAERLNVLKDFLRNTLNSGGLTFFPHKHKYRIYPDTLASQHYHFYFFENVLGDALWLICAHADVQEVPDTV